MAKVQKVRICKNLEVMKKIAFLHVMSGSTEKRGKIMLTHRKMGQFLKPVWVKRNLLLRTFLRNDSEQNWENQNLVSGGSPFKDVAEDKYERPFSRITVVKHVAEAGSQVSNNVVNQAFVWRRIREGPDFTTFGFAERFEP